MREYFTQDHEWIKIDGDVGTVGITPYAAGQLGDVVFVELPEIGRTVAKGDEVAIVESVKAASEVYAPVSGEVTGINDKLEEAPETVNESADDAGWFLTMVISQPSELESLMDGAAYQTFCEGL